MALGTWLSRLGPLVANMGPLLTFYLANHFFGLRAAVAASAVVTVGEVAYKRIRRQPLSMFFLFCATMSLGFGAVDLWLATPTFFKYEAAVSNLVTALYFGLTIRAETPLLEELAGDRARKTDAELAARNLTRADLKFFMRVMTAVWTVYFLLKAVLYAALAHRYSLEEALALRAAIGNASLYGLLGISIFGGRSIMNALGSLGLLPSRRGR